MTTDANDSTNNQKASPDNSVRSAIFSAHAENRLTVAKFADLCSDDGVSIPQTANPVVLLIPPIVHQKRHVILKHTSEPSPTQAPTPPPAGGMTPMFNSAEHESLGNDVLLSFPASTQVPASQYKLKLPNTLQLTFGQIVSLGGDYFGDIVTTSHPGGPGDYPTSTTEIYEISDGPNPQVFMASFNALAVQSNALTIVPAILAVMQQEIDAIEQAVAAGDQPSTGYANLDLDGQYNVATGGGSAASDYYPPGTYLELASVNWDHFGPNAITAYNAGHAAAIQQAISARSNSGTLDLAYAMDAFSCHFLTDLFASGHMRTPRKQLNEDATPTLAGDFLAQAMHDEDNYFGLIVTNNPVHQTVPTQTWKAFGDANAFDTMDLINLHNCVGAVQQSVNEIYAAYTSGVAPTYYGALDYVVNLSQFTNVRDEANSAALFYYQSGTGYARENITDETNYDWTSWWTAANTLRLIKKRPAYSAFTQPLNTIYPPTTAITGFTNYLYPTPDGPWIAGNYVRYAVSFYDQNNNNESVLGPWKSDVISSKACPMLNGIPICTEYPTGANIGRKVYRQFLDSDTADITYSQLIATIPDNTSTQVQDNSVSM